MTEQSLFFTIGHSLRAADEFVSTLKRYGISAIADVRSSPGSKYAPHFNKLELSRRLNGAGIDYVFLGKELGARSEDKSCYVNGKVQYERLASTQLFEIGLRRLMKGAETRRIAIMCTEKDPLDCHRTLLVADRLHRRGMQIEHILGDSGTESHSDSMGRLREKFGLHQDDLFHTADEITREAMKLQEDRIAYVDESLVRAEGNMS